jgi:hypothetical protein
LSDPLAYMTHSLIKYVTQKVLKTASVLPMRMPTSMGSARDGRERAERGDTINGTIEESNSIERLEDRASIAKRDARSKQKQIAQFVQKLSR